MKKPAQGNAFPLPPAFFPRSLFTVGVLFAYLTANTTIIALTAFFLLTQPKLYQSTAKHQLYNLYSSQPPILGAATVSRGTGDARPVMVEQFLAKYHSPLTAYADLIVAAADELQIPWTLLPAIAGQESTFCRDGSYPEDSYNCWGWAIHTSYTKKFASFAEGITKVTAGLANYYETLNIDRRSSIEEQVRLVKTRYNPTSQSWDRGVLYFISELNRFATL
jgi:hypothetical protein